MRELKERLPVKFEVPDELTELVEMRRLRHYQSEEALHSPEFKPDTWYVGEEANAILPRAQPEVVAETSASSLQTQACHRAGFF